MDADLATATINLFASVLVDQAVDKSLDYVIPQEFQDKIMIGMRVLVPLRNRLCKATVIATKQKTDIKQIKSIHSLLEDSLISKDLLKLAHWMSHYYATSLHQVLKVIFPSKLRNETVSKKQRLLKPLVSKEKLQSLCAELRLEAPAQALILEQLLLYPKGIFLSELKEKISLSQSALKQLEKKNLLSCELVILDQTFLLDLEFFKSKAKKLTDEQTLALKKIQKSIRENVFETHLVYGVTGSGKTEIFLQAIDEVLKKGQGVIYLVPEISLTSQTIERLKSRFSQNIAVLHHRLSQGQRYEAWQQIQQGHIKIVLGARSAVFSPVPNLGLIIVDEEHEGAYKQTDEAPRYHARDIAVMRGKLCQCPVILASASPSLESFHNAKEGKYILSCLSKRIEEAKLPKVNIVNMLLDKNKKGSLFSDLLLEAIKKRISVGEQTLLFLNRRGYRTSSLCPMCSHVLECPHCDLTLTYHRGAGILACHLCDYRIDPPRECPKCRHPEMKFKGAGTEMVERALHAIFPEVRTLRLDADSTKHKGSFEKIFKQFRSGKADVLIGTQMIAKGLHFPMVTLVGILNTDGSLHVPDFRASETVFQLLLQVAGRSGRSGLSGEVIIQTHLPDHPVISLAAKQDYEAFYQLEMESRQLFDYPPFSHLVKLVFSGDDEQKVEKEATKFKEALLQKLPATVAIHPVVPCGYAKIKNVYRFQCLIKGKAVGPILKVLKELDHEIDPTLRMSIDVDPISTYL